MPRRNRPLPLYTYIVVAGEASVEVPAMFLKPFMPLSGNREGRLSEIESWRGASWFSTALATLSTGFVGVHNGFWLLVVCLGKIAKMAVNGDHFPS